MAENKEARKIHRLKRQQNIKTVMQLLEWKNEIETTHPSHAAIAKRLETALGFTVTLQNVRRLSKDLELKWKPQYTKRRSARPGGLTRNNVYRRLNMAEKQIAALRDAVQNLCGRLGEAPPPMVAADWPGADVPPANG